MLRMCVSVCVCVGGGGGGGCGACVCVGMCLYVCCKLNCDSHRYVFFL